MEHQLVWDDLRVLLAVHRYGSFQAAGQVLAVSTSTVARRISALEEALGTVMLHREPTGARLMPEALALVALAEKTERALSDVVRAGRVTGRVRVSMGDGFVGPLAPVLVGVSQRHPEVQVELVSESRMVDLSEREAEVGVRMLRSGQPDLIERPVGQLRFRPYAAPSYIEHRLRTRRLSPGTFAPHDFLSHASDQPLLPQERWLTERGAVRFRFRSNTDAAIVAAARHGLGIVLLADTLPWEGLHPIDVEPPLLSLPFYLAYHRDLRKNAAVQVVVQALVEAAAAHPPLEGGDTNG